jgi:hypothetical protein
MNRQLALISKKGKRTIVSRNWKTWSAPKSFRHGKFRKWGIVKELHSNFKILCDFDSSAIPAPCLYSLVHTLGLTVEWFRYDRTKRGWHLIIKVKEFLTDAEIIACSLILGSDIDRARLDLTRAISIRLHPSKFWHKRVSILFDRKIKVKNVV